MLAEKENTKEIPNLIRLNIDSTYSRNEALFIEKHFLEKYAKRIENGFRFTPFEFDEFCALILLNFRQEETPKWVYEYSYSDSLHKKLKDNVQFELIKLKWHREEITNDEKQIFYRLFATKKKKIQETYLKAILDSGVSKKKASLWEVELKNLVSTVEYFESKTLIEWFTPIYLDLEMLLHIYTRHTRETFLNQGPYKGKTLFQYKIGDIINLLKCAIKVIEDEIKEHFCETAGTRKPLRKKFTYNNDSYQLRINSNGRITQFHQLELATDSYFVQDNKNKNNYAIN